VSLTVAIPLHTLSPSMQVVYDAAVAAARTDASVLILGEDGAGKSILAARIHGLSRRAEKPLISVHMAALPVHLAEANLFGSAADPAGLAKEPQLGVLEKACGSTIVLQHLGYAEGRIRERVLETLKTRTITRQGDGRPVPVDMRFIATIETNPLSKRGAATSVVEECCRQFDVTLTIPPLRERAAEVPELALIFARAQEPDFASERIPAPIVALLSRYTWWRSNLLELRCVIAAAVVLSEGHEIRLEHFPPWIVELAEGP
jgi:two-component system, NtrC family, response regulator HydG